MRLASRVLTTLLVLVAMLLGNAQGRCTSATYR